MDDLLIKKRDNAIDYYEDFSVEYDDLAAKYHWVSPDVMFGMLYRYTKPMNKLLDVGIGTGLSSVSFNKAGMKIYGLDGSRKMLSICKRKKISCHLGLSNLEKDIFPYLDNYFDMVISNGVCYFIKNIEHYLKESVRVLKVGGIFSFNYEHIPEYLSEEFKGSLYYENKSNTVISKKLKQKTGVTVYKYNKHYVRGILEAQGLKILEEISYYAYTSPSTKEDVYFTLLVVKK